MLEIVLFAMALVVSQIIGGLIIMDLMMSEKFVKRYTKKMMKIMKEVEDDMYE